MKKLLIAISAFFLATSSVLADVKIGAKITGIEFSGAKGTEETRGVVTSETDSISAAYGSIFAEVDVMGFVSVGIDFIPYSIEGETVSNQRRNSSGTVLQTNLGSIDIENHATLYFLKNIGDAGAFVKLGASYADATTTESNSSGRTYTNDEVYGGHLGLGFEKDVSEFFVRAEVGYSEYSTAVFKSSSNKTRIKAALGDGVHAALSLGKSF